MIYVIAGGTSVESFFVGEYSRFQFGDESMGASADETVEG